MFRSSLLYLSNQPRVFRFVRNNRLAKKFATRFVAGETLDEALAAVRALNAQGITASLDLLGESVTNEREARAAARRVSPRSSTAFIEQQLDANVSVKLTAMGLDISEELCVAIMHDVLDRAQQYDTFVRLDMESSAYTERTLRAVRGSACIPAYKENVGIVLQSYLYRTWSDVERAFQLKCRVRICKGAYKEPASVAFPEKKEVDANYVKCMHELIERGNYPGIATHDPAIIDEAKRFVDRAATSTLAASSSRCCTAFAATCRSSSCRRAIGMRVYVPFGTQWYPYLMRRLAERPANVAFITGNVMREMIGRRKS